MRLPDEMDLRDGALVEPLSCAVRGFDVVAGRLGDRVLIYGAGTMGLLNTALALRAGAAPAGAGRKVQVIPGGVMPATATMRISSGASSGRVVRSSWVESSTGPPPNGGPGPGWDGRHAGTGQRGGVRGTS